MQGDNHGVLNIDFISPHSQHGVDANLLRTEIR